MSHMKVIANLKRNMIPHHQAATDMSKDYCFIQTILI